MTQDKFKKTIDNARQILVGKLPNPQDQIDAITYALMYKFMNDIDDKSASLPGGKRTYFAGDYEKYSWHNLMRADGQDQLILYREAIEKMSKNSNLPLLFREIFTGAMLKFNDPRTLRLFLKEMDEFTHGNGDSLGDSYEYLLSLMGSQGGLGQFRTPRHIIKFIVDAVDPDKTDRIIDPAVGTGGFLIEAYNHILRKHDGRDEYGNQTNSEKRLTAGELDKIHSNFTGFDIDATMIRTARVNLYLHDFKTPDIIEHDSLTSEDYWTDRYDVILANPPFMSPKGGIQPHKKFGVQANRAEVLFVDYIASHLKPTGKAGVVVPEGVVFKNETAYYQLRKNLVDNSLIAVVSLPAGVFQPYSGGKTNVLLLDLNLAKERQNVLFIKVENDGFSLSKQRRVIADNDLPQALDIVKYFKESGSLPEHTSGIKAQLVPRGRIAEDVSQRLDYDRYQESDVQVSSYEQIRIAELVYTVSPPVKLNKTDYLESGKYPIIDQSQAYIVGYTDEEDSLVPSGEYVIFGDHTKAVKYTDFRFAQGADGIKILRAKDGVNVKFLYYTMRQLKMPDKGYSRHWSVVKDIKIPIPPIEVQNDIVKKIDDKQQAIDHARGVIRALERERRYFNPRPLAVKNGWPSVKLGDVLDYEQPTKYIVASVDYNDKYKTPVLTAGKTFILGNTNETDGIYPVDNLPVIIFDDFTTAIKFVDFPFKVKSSAMKILRVRNPELADIRYLYNVMLPIEFNAETHKRYWIQEYSNIEIPLPPLDAQKQIIQEFAEQDKWLEGAKNTITYMENAINNTLSELWSD